MADPALASRSALPFSPIGPGSGAWRLAPLPEGPILLVLAEPAGTEAGERLGAIGQDGVCVVRPALPGQWFAIAEPGACAEALRRRIADALPGAAISDQSHGRVRLSLSGAGAEGLLAKGSFVDASQAAFPVGRSAQTLFGHVAIHLTRVAPDGFELMVLRSFALGLWEEFAAGL